MKKNDRVLAITTIFPLITFGKQYTVLGVKRLPSNEVLVMISTDRHKKQYMSAEYFVFVDNELRRRLRQEDL